MVWEVGGKESNWVEPLDFYGIAVAQGEETYEKDPGSGELDPGGWNGEGYTG